MNIIRTGQILTIAEVYESIKSQRGEADGLPLHTSYEVRSKFLRHMGGLMSTESLLMGQLEEYPSHTLTREQNERLKLELAPFGLRPRELVCIMSHLPQSLAYLNPCIADCEKRYSEAMQAEIVDIVNKYRPADAVDEDQQEEQE